MKENLKYIENLLQGETGSTGSPQRVEWKSLGEVCGVLRGKRLTRQELSDDEKYPVFHGGLEPLGYYSKSNRQANTVMIINVGASAGTVGYSDVDFWSSDGCFCLKHSDTINNKFLYYYLIGEQHFLKSRVRVAGIPTLDNFVVANLLIPIPPLSVQQEIVRILDKFTTLTAELTAELTARKKQYSYYRESLLTFQLSEPGHFDPAQCKFAGLNDEQDNNSTSSPQDVQWKSLGEVGEFIRGGGLQKKDFTETGVGCIHYGQIYTHYGTSANKTKTFVSEEFAKKARKAKQGNLVIATTSENDEDVCKAVVWLGKEDIAISSDACFYSHTMVPKYVAYFFQTEHFQKQKRPFITGTKVRRVNADDLAKIKIPIPPLSEQERIVAILDKFDTLTHSISEGLPKEIELRQKQYAYYRDKLLTFV